MRFVFLSLLAVCLAGSALAQETAKRPLTHADYDGWQSIRQSVISRDGKWVAYVVSPQVGDSELIVRATATGTEFRHPCGTSPRFTVDGRFVVFRISGKHADLIAYELFELNKKSKKPGAAKEKKKDAEKEKDDPEKPVPSLGILDLASGEVEVIARVSTFSVPSEDVSCVVYRHQKPKKKKPKKKAKGKKPAKKEKSPEEAGEKKPEKPKAESAKKEKKKPEKPKKYLSDGTKMVVRWFDGRQPIAFDGVVSSGITRKKGILYFVRSSKKSKPKIERGCFAMDLASGKVNTLVKGGARYRSFSTDREVTRLVFLSDRATRDAEKPTNDIYAWDFAAPEAERLVSHQTTPGFPKGKCVSGNRLSFSRDGRTLMLAVQDLPEKDPPKILSRHRVKLDLWHWKDPLLQPMQAKRSGRLRSTALAAVWDFEDRRLSVVGRTPRESVRFITPDGARALVTDSTRYAQEISWDGRYSDAWLLNTLDGSRRPVVAHARGFVRSSPNGRFLVHFDGTHWHAHDVEENATRNLTESLPVSFASETWDTPQPARDYGVGGWAENDEAVLLYDRYDIWCVNPRTGAAKNVTDGYGRAAKIRLRYVRTDPEERHVPAKKPLLLSASNEETMASGYFTDELNQLARPRKIVMLEKSFGRVTKARDADRFIYRLSTFEESELYVSAGDFADRKRLSNVSAQQADIRWGNAELVRWRSADGVALKGILVKPDGFDPTKKYPMMVYFYEKLSGGLHRYRSPAPGTSPNAAYYVSNGYLWFMPDIVYRDGYPGESCLKCVVSGVQKLIERGYVQEDAIGAAGHSWGGYQTAYLVTKTNIFKAVESGAPVSNMTSAYGGIRWGTGMSRAFQYERTQSRIGGSLWQYPMRYLENSPVFSADKVETPVLMLHNDQDGAVPWYQGIEYFCALRRLGKEVYMFNYVGGGHGLRKRANQIDWTMRMQQYFDHHLRGAAMPAWMRDGVPYVDRDREKLRFNPPPESKPKPKAQPAPKPAKPEPVTIQPESDPR